MRDREKQRHGDQLKIRIISSFGVPGSAPFAVGEELDVPKGVATVWIDAGRAMPLETEPDQPATIPAPAIPEVSEQAAAAKPKHKQRR